LQFQASTTLVAISAIIGVLGVQMLIHWWRDRDSPWLAWFGGTLLVAAASLPLYFLPPELAFVDFGGGNALRIGAFGLLWMDARVFNGRRPDILWVVLAGSVWLALCSLPPFLGSVYARALVASLMIAGFLLLGAWELWRDRHEEYLPSRVPTIAIYLSFSILMLLRVAILRIAPYPVGILPVRAEWVAGFSLAVFIHCSFLVGFMLSMTRERRESEQRSNALSDPLTGLLNRRAFLDELARHNRRRHGPRDRIAVLVLDLDDFKQVNDRYGHEVGDRVLQNFADTARRVTRAGDLLFRMGGEEFCFVLPGASISEAGAVAERIRTRFEQSFVAHGGERVGTTVSIGIASSELTSHDFEQLLAAGDSAVYEAKARGRNRTVVAQPTALARPAARRAAIA
jgi:diguanylate cyclase (GGDEF)-like protein